MKKYLSPIARSIVLFAVLFSALSAAQIYSQQDGNWNATSTWVGGVVPDKNDEVIINHTVDVTAFAPVERNRTTTVNARVRLNDGFTNLNNNILYVKGTLEIRAGGFVAGTTPDYAVGSVLRYNTNSASVYARNVEWGVAGSYIPYHVNIAAGTSVNLGANSGANISRQTRGNLSVDGNLYMDYASDNMTQSLTVSGHLTVNGNLSLSNTLGGDLKLAGDLTVGSAGNLYPKARAVYFLKNGQQTVTNSNASVNPFIIPYVVFDPSAGGTVTVNLAGVTDYHLSAPNGGKVIDHISGAVSTLNIGSRKLIIGTSGVPNYINYGGTAYATMNLAGSVNSSLELLGNGQLGTLNFVANTENLKDLTLNRNSPGVTAVTLASDLSVNGSLSLQNGVIKTVKILNLTVPATVTGGSAQSFVSVDGDYGNGRLRRSLSINNAAFSFQFPVGDDQLAPTGVEGLQYSPITINIKKTSSTSAAYIDMQVFDKNAITDADTNYISRHWKMSMSGISNPGYTATAQYYDTDVVGTESSLKNYIFKSDENDWTQVGGNVDAGNNLVSFNKSEGYTVTPVPAAYHLITGAEKAKKREINVRGNGMTIESGDVTPQIYDNTDFGTTTVGNNVIKIFRLENLGTQNLQISNIAIQNAAGTAASTDFTLLSPTSHTIAGGAFVDIQIQFNAAGAAGLRTARIFIDNNDPNEADYNFRVQGTIEDFIGCSGFRILGVQNFEAEPAFPEATYTVSEQVSGASHIVSGGNGYVGTQIKDKYLGGRSLQVFNAHTILEFNGINLTGTISPYLSLDLAALGYIPGSGPENLDYASVSVSSDGGLTWVEQFRISPNTVSYWSFDNTNPIFQRVYSTGPYTQVPVNSSTGHQYLITELPKVGSLKVKIELKSNDLNRIWALDDVLFLDDTSKKIWNGTSWTGVNTSPPTFLQKAVFEGDYSTASGNVTACECEVKPGKQLTVLAGHIVEIQNSIVNNGLITVESDGNFIQRNDNGTYIGSGTGFKAKRTVSGVRNSFAAGQHMDYIYWSSPVSGQGLKAFSPGTPNNRFYQYNETNDYFNSVNLTAEPNFTAAKGYAIRAEDGLPYGYSKTYEFTGTPNNGLKTIGIQRSPDNGAIQHGYNLIGNPYPSNINFDTLHLINSAKIYKTAWFWVNDDFTIYQTGSGYVGNGYAVYNGTGGNGGTTDSNPAHIVVPDGTVKVGQGFIVQMKNPPATNPPALATVIFNNSMRASTAGTFYQKGSGKSRFWLKLVSPSQTVNTQLIGYVDGATNGFEQDYDAESFGLSSDLFYSKLDDKLLVIQGKGMFTTTDKVILGANFFKDGTYTISVQDKEGIFAGGQHIYLKDTQTGIITNLSEGGYTFSVKKGLSEGRFEIIYQPQSALATGGTVRESITVYRDGNDFVVRSSEKAIENLELYDVAGRLVLYLKGNEREIRFSADPLLNGIYVLKAQLKDGEIFTKKIKK